MLIIRIDDELINLDQIAHIQFEVDENKEPRVVLLTGAKLQIILTKEKAAKFKTSIEQMMQPQPNLTRPMILPGGLRGTN